MNWRKWIRPALIVTVVAAPLAVVMEKGGIERDLQGRVGAALVANGQDWAKVATSAQDVTLSGIAPAPEAQAIALKAAAGVSGVRAVSDQSLLLPVAAPYVWSVHRAAQQLTLTGSVPSDGVRASLLAAARRALPAGEIVDRMTLARGASATFSAATTFALARVAGLSDGQITLTDSTLSLTGTAADAAAYAAFHAGFARDVPASVDVGALDVLPSRVARFVWSANLDSASVTLAGNVPNDVVRQALAGAIKAALPGLPVVDGATVASGDPPGFAEAASFAVSALQHLQRGGVTLDGLSLDVAGDARSVDDYAALMDSLAHGVPAGVTVVSAALTPAAVSPYVWQANVADGKVTFTGYAPTADRRDELAQYARTALPGLAVDDQTRIARGEPRMDWVGAVKFAIGQLGLMGRGTVAITETGYTVSGEAKDAKTYAQILDQNAHTLPGGLVLKIATVTAPRVTPFRFVAERRGTGIAITGYVPSDEDRQAILASARRVAGIGEVTDTLIFASGAPAGFVTAATAAVRSLTRLAGGRVEISEQAVSIAGTTYQEAAVTEVNDALDDALPPGFAVAHTAVAAAEVGQPLTAGACRDQLQAVLKAGRIEFDANNPVVTTDSLGVLDRVAGTVFRCPDAQIEVGVHSDNDGTATPGVLHDRTQARADAIVDYLAGAGVTRERLSAVGYGATKPIADNGTAPGRASNRRVEFTVAVPAGG